MITEIQIFLAVVLHFGSGYQGSGLYFKIRILLKRSSKFTADSLSFLSYNSKCNNTEGQKKIKTGEIILNRNTGELLLPHVKIPQEESDTELFPAFFEH